MKSSVVGINLSWHQVLIDGGFLDLQVSEDLGRSSQAIFGLERGFSVTTGADQNDHPYYIGLANDGYGALTPGHQYDSIHDYPAPFKLTGGNGARAFAHPFDNDNTNNSCSRATQRKNGQHMLPVSFYLSGA